MMNMQTNQRAILAIVFSAVIVCQGFGANVSETTARIDSAKLIGGFVVQVGGSKSDMAALAESKHLVIHGLNQSPKVVEEVRKTIRSTGTYGTISVQTYDGKHLPYIDNMVNLIVISEPNTQLPKAEILRVLVPGGKALVNGKTIKKPIPGDIDEWPQFLYDSGNNAVAQDKLVGHPRTLQWQATPDWTRNHHKLASVSSMVSTGGKVFYVVDEQSGHDMSLPGQWSLTARDAFNGLLLWKRPVEKWLDTTRKFRSGPMQIARTLAATKEHVYSLSQLEGPVLQLDANTGRLIQSFDDTKKTEEFVLNGDRLFVIVAEGKSEIAIPDYKDKLLIHPNKKKLLCIDTRSGKVVWSWQADRIEDTPIPQTLATSGDRVYFAADEFVFSVDRASGKVVWKSEARDNIVEYPWFPQIKKGSHAGRRAGWAVASLVVKDDVVIFSSGHRVDRLDYKTGKSLWNTKGQAGCLSPIDIFIIGDKVWIGNQPLLFAEGGYGKYHVDTGIQENKHLEDLTRIRTMGHHHRCYRDKATTEFIIDSYRGIEMLDLDGESHSRNNWTRGLCQYGVMPANGFIYVPPHGCGCYPEALLKGFLALGSTSPRPATIDAKGRVKEGPAFAKVQDYKATDGDWVTLRGNMRRSGTTSQQLSERLKSKWNLPLGKGLGPPVVADGLVLVADKETHQIHAVDISKGVKKWSFTADGRIDSPPTLHQGMAVFGCRDGKIYCLRLFDGAVVWTFLAAPSDHRICVRGQLESLWPVFGSVLIKDDLVYAAAGRNTYLDGGMELYTLNVNTGEVVYHRTLTSEAPRILSAEEDQKLNDKYPVKKIHQNRIDYKSSLIADKSDSFSIKGGSVNDLLSSDGKHVFLHFSTFSKEWEKQEEQARHLYSTYSLLSGKENRASHWFLGYGNFQKQPFAYHWAADRAVNKKNKQMVNSFGIMLSFDDQSVWRIVHGINQYQLLQSRLLNFEDVKNPPNDLLVTKEKKDIWNVKLKMWPRAIVRAGSHVFLLGAPEIKSDLKSSSGIIRSFRTNTGEASLTLKLPAAPVWDGVAVAQKKMFVSLENGSLQCLGD
jgi:outer membrane protein assembly factor BamB